RRVRGRDVELVVEVEGAVPPLAAGGAAEQVEVAVAVDVGQADVAPAGRLVPGHGREREERAAALVEADPPLAGGGAAHEPGPAGLHHLAPHHLAPPPPLL